MDPKCIKCGGELELFSEGVQEFTWRCVDRCGVEVRTGVPTIIDISKTQKALVKEGRVEISAFINPLTKDRIWAAKVYMPQIFYHFIECTWGGCYNSIYKNCIVPHLDCTEVIDYVLHTEVIHSGWEGTTGARIYGDLLHRLQGVDSPKIAEYLNETFRIER